MRKKGTFICLALLLVFGVIAGVCAQEERPFDNRLDKRSLIEVDDLKFELLFNVADLATDQDNVAMSIAMAWYNLLHGELQQNIPIDETMAAAIYRGFNSGAAVACVTASDPENTYFNVIFAVTDVVDGFRFGMAYWIEWDVEKKQIRAFSQYGVDGYMNDEEYLSDYVLNSLLYASLDASIFAGPRSVPSNAINHAFGRDAGIVKMFDWAYAKINDQQSVPFK